MALRFRKSIKLAPGIRWNLSGSGSSFTLGPRGASVGIGKRGTFLNTGIPGTGLSSRSALAASSRSPGTQPTSSTSVSMTCGIGDDGILFFTDKSGQPVSEQTVELAKKQNRQAILGLIERKCEEINTQVEALGRLHHDTPDSRIKPRFYAPPFDVSPPVRAPHAPLGFLDKLFKKRRERVEASNREKDRQFDDATHSWQSDKDRFDQAVALRKQLIEEKIYTDVSAMESFLEEGLSEIVWPRETDVSVDISGAGTRVMLDVDLPELEDMPTKLAAVPARGLKLSVKELTQSKVQRLYAEHVHGIVFRLVGEVFAALPLAQEVVASGYSQRRDAATAQLQDDYLLSVRVRRAEWEETDFAHLEALDVIAALGRYELRRDMLKSGVLRAITPLEEQGSDA